MRPTSHPKVVPWDQVFFLLKSPLYIVDFRHMNREHFPKKPKSGKPAALLRFWAGVIDILLLDTSRCILVNQLTCGTIGKRRPGLIGILP